ncbi:hypothetical protein NB699_001591 [Xanthomonas sacchari]|uniref:Uncharacterized protein n=1 Tax=Xanthomonas sacchari TaxID=56458 RepID=A0AA46Q5C7_9XANT|nr:hypothetical protein [Xanthomonas sacchari]MCW0366608.1 hypothetical protein [Xanthomonas sacchari]MCW0440367.1 hypothetical protein [Xanthomonas sacchari]UYK87056.1 hypothetical protein NG824_11020 [Xanthomonas sacchari]
MSFTSFKDAEQIVDRFITLLHSLGVNPAVGSKIEGELLSPLQLLESTRNLGGLADRPELLADAGGMYDFAAKLLAIATQPEFSLFIPHLRLFEAGEQFATAIQPKQGDARDDVNRKLAELYLGALAIHFAFDVDLDHPVNSKGNNPDVMFTIRREGHPDSRWALAIKTVSSHAGQTLFENVQKAAKQIDATACTADRGMVVINLKNAIQYTSLDQVTYTSLDEALALLRTQIDTLITAAEKDRPADEWEPLFAGRVSPLVFYFAHAVVRLRLPGGLEVPTILKMAKIANPLGRSDEVGECIALKLNHWMQQILRGIPGTPSTYDAPGQAPA